MKDLSLTSFYAERDFKHEVVKDFGVSPSNLNPSQLILGHIHNHILQARDEIRKRQGMWGHDDMAVELAKEDYCPRTVERYIRQLVTHGYITRIKPGVYM